MPESTEDSRQRKAGQFYSHIARQERCELLLLTEVQQAQALKVPVHEHELGYVTVVLDGYYAEDNAEGFVELPAFTTIFNPSGVVHSALIGRRGTQFFTIEFQSDLQKIIDVHLPDYPVVDPVRGAMLWPGLRMFSAFKTQTVDPLILESHLMELLGAVSDFRPVGRSAPLWFSRLKDQLHSEFRENIRIGDLAAEAGVHPIHLARVFRRHEKQTPGEYVQKLRIRAACQLLSDPEASLACVAAECGFADQSHFTRTFRKITGTTPGNFRDTLLLHSA